MPISASTREGEFSTAGAGDLLPEAMGGAPGARHSAANYAVVDFEKATTAIPVASAPQTASGTPTFRSGPRSPRPFPVFVAFPARPSLSGVIFCMSCSPVRWAGRRLKASAALNQRPWTHMTLAEIASAPVTPH